MPVLQTRTLKDLDLRIYRKGGAAEIKYSGRGKKIRDEIIIILLIMSGGCMC